ncbi:DUF2975 domain-containing protein [Pseudomonas gingeri]|uniref:DUF2975 domain-containing protein n=1 Tax=Pseudomonas gingeri TaxID=117681 RepID=A0A7Y7Y9C1_9PSED|nr:DUF2975 domain-containing protein [Pseudomonas gingeri]NWB29753.1 DUF2975 domain-containing protein [Pseudomonas gingeri]NWC31889.1 DUF2975 domain-containing protein [Pseudomonas gingeri]NWD08930.1 DUF2975 domain-containing protein [Pseudomonas gingeri]NWD47137.1 DUF2975 domain-containing protein [Pseudomonas gingeri]NWE36192.1 DUF2975 domain-containing protein [Pseudomonas gingeri]
MTSDRLASHSRLLASATLLLIIAMLLVNIACWFFPSLVTDYGVGFNLGSMATEYNVKVEDMPWWQVAGCILLSSIPLLILAKGLFALRSLFQAYSHGDYFSPESAGRLGKVGKSVGFWVLGTALLEPALSVWMTFLLPPGQRLLTLGFSSSQVVALFLAASITLIARILYNACSLARENQQFV